MTWNSFSIAITSSVLFCGAMLMIEKYFMSKGSCRPIQRFKNCDELDIRNCHCIRCLIMSIPFKIRCICLSDILADEIWSPIYLFKIESMFNNSCCLSVKNIVNSTQFNSTQFYCHIYIIFKHNSAQNNINDDLNNIPQVHTRLVNKHVFISIQALVVDIIVYMWQRGQEAK